MEKKYDHSTIEKNIQAFWQEHGVYTFDPSRGPSWTIDTPPPTVSGALHIGHLFSYTQTDLIARYRRMEGYAVFYPMGFDDNGLPTERYVEKKLKIRAHELSRTEFTEHCLAVTEQVQEDFKNLFRAVGLSVDWDKTYSTISAQTRTLSQRSFIMLYHKGYVYRRPEPALWCPLCRTAVAQAELDDQRKTGMLYTVIFDNSVNPENPFVISTSRPELIASAQALMYHPDDARYAPLAESAATPTAHVPFYDRDIPVFPDEDVDPEKGTGLVMVSTFGDKQDVIWAKRHNLEYLASITRQGKMSKDAGPLEGLAIKAAREKIVELLYAKERITEAVPIDQTVNVHERCKSPIEYLVVPQWFLSLMEYKQEFLNKANQISWHPSFMKVRYNDWVENIGWDWCISRQRFYGIPFPAWHCISCDDIILADLDQLPVDPVETPYGKPCPRCKSSDIVPDTDVMDTWNTSSLTPYICSQLLVSSPSDVSAELFDPELNGESFLPMSMRPQAHDIIRTWAFYTIVKTWMHSGKIPWKNSVISGHVLSSEQQKLSKSKGNSALAPAQLLKTYPADALRYWTASGLLGHDTTFSTEQIKQGHRVIVKLWNAFRYADEHIQQPSDPCASLAPVDQWLVHTLTRVFKRYKEAFDAYEPSHALHVVETFFYKDFCDNYLELIKDQLYNPTRYDDEILHSTRWTLRYALFAILQFFSPFFPHVTEHLYSLFFKTSACRSIHLTRYQDHIIEKLYPASAALMARLFDVIGKIRKLKTQHQLSLGAPLLTLEIVITEHELFEQLQTMRTLIKGVTRASEISFQHQSGKGDLLVKKDDEWHAYIQLD